MNKTLTRLLEPGFRVYFAVSLVFAGISAYFNVWLALGEALAILLLYWYLQSGITRRKREIIRYIESMSTDVESATRGTMANSPLPVVIFRPDTDDIIWSNDKFLALTGDRDHLFDTKLTSVVPGADMRWLTDGENAAPEPLTVGGKQYMVFGNLVRTEGESGFLATTYWVDVTHYVALEEAFLSSRPVVAILLIDNYEDLVRGLEDDSRTALLSEINRRISQWADPAQGLLFRYDRDHHLFLFESHFLAGFQQKKFAVLDAVREVQSPNGISASLSLGIGRDAPSLRELFHYATLSTDMALSRGGDQVVIKDSFNFQFFGGRARESERRTKVKSRVMANALSELIVNSSQVLIMGHRFADLDVVGAAAGVFAIARKRGVKAYIIREEGATPAEPLLRRLSALPEYLTGFRYPGESLELLDNNTVLVVVDTNRPEQVVSQELLEACPRVVVIDHHRRAASYITNPVMNFHDPYASSASELVAELVQYILEPGDLLRAEAEAILSGIVLDTKNFTMRTGGRTFDAAAFLRRSGADTAEVKKYFQNDLPGTVAKYQILQQAKLYRKNIAIAALTQSVGRITAAKAADELLNVTGVEASFVLFPEEDEVIFSARSNGDVNVQVILEALGGGGNAATAGAQMAHITPVDAAKALKKSIDDYLEE